MIEWKSVKKELPNTSRDVLCAVVDKRGNIIWIAILPYSTKHNVFNANDFDEIPEYALDIDYWAEKPLLIREEDVSSNGD